ncbi:hypothetical protein D6783_06130 [Candidatus Woesearchaeota archaeon]|nr:MAG: hypothetical protein D6783_06130 [Candidatus Woesearchaeota archaeon]
MAKVIFGGGVSEIRGSIAGQVFSRNGSGAYIRNRVTPVNPQSASQSGVRQNLGAIATAWKDLTEQQRNAWKAAAAGGFTQRDSLGNAFQLSGQQLFMKLNTALFAAGSTGVTLTDPPAEVSLDQLQNAALVSQTVTGTFSITLSGDLIGTGANQKLVVFATRALSQGISNPRKAEFKLIGAFDMSGSGGSFDLTAAYSAKFPEPPDGGKVFVRFHVLQAQTGQTSNSTKVAAVHTVS